METLLSMMQDTTASPDKSGSRSEKVMNASYVQTYQVRNLYICNPFFKVQYKLVYCVYCF